MLVCGWNVKWNLAHRKSEVNTLWEKEFDFVCVFLFSKKSFAFEFALSVAKLNTSNVSIETWFFFLSTRLRLERYFHSMFRQINWIVVAASISNKDNNTNVQINTIRMIFFLFKPIYVVLFSSLMMKYICIRI